MMKKQRICVKQHAVGDCGAACLAAIGRHYGLRIPLEQIRMITGTQVFGVSLQGLCEGAKALHFDTCALSLSPAQRETQGVASLEAVPTPAILHTLLPNGLLHFVVYCGGARGGRFLIMDPQDGELHKMSAQELNARWSGIVVTLTPNAQFTPKDTLPHFWPRILRLLQQHRTALWVALIASLMVTALGLVPSLFIERLTDHILPLGQRTLLHKTSLAVAVSTLVLLASGALNAICLLKTGVRIGSTLSKDFYRHIVHLPQSFFDLRQTGELTSRLADAFKVSSFVSRTLIHTVLCVFTLGFSLCYFYSVYWKAALWCTLALPLYALVYYVFDKKNKTVRRDIALSGAAMQSQLVDSLRNTLQIKLSGAQEQTIEKTNHLFDTYMAHSYRGGLVSVASSLSGEGVSRLLSIGLLWIGGTFVLRGHLSLGQLVAFYTLTGYLCTPATGLLSFSESYREAAIAAERLFEIMELEPERLVPILRKTTASLQTTEFSALCFMRIKYHYKGRLTLFSNFNYTFYPQKITAIAGESGSGKSTLASLLLRLYLPDEGSITLGGIPAEDIPLPLWRQWISLVPQQPAIIEGTLYDNIVYGCATHSPQDVAQLCDLLGLTSFIEQLPQGLFTHLGEQGAQLSGGQRQRIALARAAYRRPKWLIMDEATSSLDSSSEGFIFNAITQWHREGMGIIIIAHRLSSLSIAHQILLLKEGAIAGEGSHATLLSTNEQYAAWCRQQAI